MNEEDSENSSMQNLSLGLDETIENQNKFKANKTSTRSKASKVTIKKYNNNALYPIEEQLSNNKDNYNEDIKTYDNIDEIIALEEQYGTNKDPENNMNSSISNRDLDLNLSEENKNSDLRIISEYEENSEESIDEEYDEEGINDLFFKTKMYCANVIEKKEEKLKISSCTNLFKILTCNLSIKFIGFFHSLSNFKCQEYTEKKKSSALKNLIFKNQDILYYNFLKHFTNWKLKIDYSKVAKLKKKNLILENIFNSFDDDEFNKVLEMDLNEICLNFKNSVFLIKNFKNFTEFKISNENRIEYLGKVILNNIDKDNLKTTLVVECNSMENSNNNNNSNFINSVSNKDLETSSTSIPLIPTLQNIPNIPLLLGTSEISKIPKIPIIPKISEVQSLQGSIPGISGVPLIPAIPGVPSIPGIPGIPSIPGIPKFPVNKIPTEKKEEFKPPEDYITKKITLTNVPANKINYTFWIKQYNSIFPIEKDKISILKKQIDEELLLKYFAEKKKLNEPVKKINDSNALKKDTVEKLLDDKRIMNLGIALAKLSISNLDLKEIIMNFERNKKISIEDIDKITPMLPTKEDKDKLNEFCGNLENISNVEKFIVILIKIPMHKEALDYIKINKILDKDVNEILIKMKNIYDCIDAIISSSLFLKFLYLILNISCYLNHGTRNSSLQGFKLQALSQVESFKAVSEKNFTLVDYLVKILKARDHHLLAFYKELSIEKLETCLEVHIFF